MTLLPSPISRELFNLAMEIQPHYNLLYHRVAHDYNFLKEVFSEVRKSDDFIRRLLEIHELVREESGAPKICLEISRSDYLIDSCEDESDMIKQVENNTIACALVGLSPLLIDYHR